MADVKELKQEIANLKEQFEIFNEVMKERNKLDKLKLEQDIKTLDYLKCENKLMLRYIRSGGIIALTITGLLTVLYLLLKGG